MAASVEWDDNANLPARTHSWRVWAAAMTLVISVVVAAWFLIVRTTTGAASDGCRLHEVREGIPGLEKLDVPLVGQQPQPGWKPPANVRVRYVKTDSAVPGAVVDETMCGQPHGQILVTVAR